ncbi:TetR/AcrR family transcriptional regulator [Curtobacterium oceanosedimentum]|uniref:TetR/AcrR family transcriptional regulator n=1 Tax=Curtobacterium oceanosedimentum TaxID=465820 RepID=UPI001CE1E710|nr:TetR/AcrR family transcriptional regulator [Curtobacterium oceanosedimentum]MCA5922064.1 TetR/AcrR family transcriptional regulator [Curtobacterium oceanosedimentum]
MEPLQGERVADDESLAERTVRAAIRAYRLHPFDAVDASVVAEVAGVSLETVERLFPTWDALLLVTYDRWAQLRGSRRVTEPSCTIDHVRLTLAEDVADPGLVRVLAGVVTIASSESRFSDLFRKRFEEYVEELTVGLQRDFDRGVEESSIPAYQAATQLLAVYEGMQIQMLVRPYIDVLVEFDRAVGTLRQGWKRHDVPSWDLDEVPVRV